MAMDGKRAYRKEYLLPNMDLHRLLFVQIEHETPYNAFDMIDAYMQTSQIRAKQDIGNWSALCKGYKQLLHDIDTTGCSTKKQLVDDIFLHWAADIYVLLQWMYNLSSKEINTRISARELWKIYNPLHETSEQNACDKIYHIYFEKR